MMFWMTLLLGLLMLTTLVISPAYRFQQARIRQKALRSFHLFKLRAVQRHYSHLTNLSLNQIDGAFDVDQLYNSISSYKINRTPSSGRSQHG